LVFVDAVLLYLTARVWASGATSEKLAREVLNVMHVNVPILLVHERPSIEANASQEPRFECDFDDFFVDTPVMLLQAHVYKDIAVPLAGGEARRTSLLMLVNAISATINRAKFSSVDAWIPRVSSSFGRMSDELLSSIAREHSVSRNGRYPSPHDRGSSILRRTRLSETSRSSTHRPPSSVDLSGCVTAEFDAEASVSESAIGEATVAPEPLSLTAVPELASHAVQPEGITAPIGPETDSSRDSSSAAAATGTDVPPCSS
jgi:hypothetical protein